MSSSGELVVDVAGAVMRPGLHHLSPGDRVGDAIAAAGGYAPRADLAATSASLNLAQPLQDGAKVLVPELGLDPVASAPDDGRVDLNRAGQTELESLPGIGPVTARKIIDSRTERRFAAVRDLRCLVYPRSRMERWASRRRESIFSWRSIVLGPTRLRFRSLTTSAVMRNSMAGING